MIPPDRAPAVARALRAAFGVEAADSAVPLTGDDGLASAPVYRVEVGGRSYVLRFVKDGFPGVDPAREHAAARRAGEAGIGPRVHHASTEDGLLLTDYVPSMPIPSDAGRALARTLRRLHELPAPAPTTRYLDGIDRFVRRIPGFLPSAASDALLRGYAAASAAWPRDDRAWVGCHNDLKPPNTLWDGARFQLVDWEAAFANDRYVDLAIAAAFHAPDDDGPFLAAYLDRSPTDDERARLLVMRTLVGVAYVAIFGGIAARAGVSVDEDADVPGFAAFHREIVAGRDLASGDAARTYAAVHARRALQTMADPTFADAVARVAVSSAGELRE